MNQILVTEKLYITPELKQKRKIYKLGFFLSVFLICLLFSFYIYAEYDKTKSELVSKDILEQLTTAQEENRVREIDDTMIRIEDNVLIFVLDEKTKNDISLQGAVKKENSNTGIDPSKIEYRAAPSGDQYYTIGIVNIPKINVNYPILSKTTDELLKISPTKFWGPDPNEIGNLCISGHNYKNSKFFSKVPTLQLGDIVEITDLNGRTITYMVYDNYIVDPEDVRCTSQMTNGKKEITLITCTDDNKKRVIVKAEEVIQRN